MSESVTGRNDGCEIPHLERAIEALEDALHADDMTFQQWAKIQEHYHDLAYISLARDMVAEHPKDLKFDGFTTGLSRPHDFDPSDDVLPVVKTPVRFFGYVTARDPKNPFTRHTLHLDHVVKSDGSVEVEVEGVPLDEVGERPGSFVR